MAIDITDIKIRAFRAIDDPSACEKFIEGHMRVLKIFGIEMITSAKNKWMENPAVFVISVETLDGEKMFGGARVQAANGIYPLPLEDAAGGMDPNIFKMVKHCSHNGTGELCGLWNSKEVAGLGIGSLFASRAAVIIAEQIGLQSMFSLCAPATVRFSEWIGSRIETSLGNNGTFYYPKIDLIATVMFLEDAINLPKTPPAEREKMFSLRKNPRQVITERSPFKKQDINIHYDLVVKSANPFEFKIPKITKASPAN
ncbi:MAG: hypothetical protein ACYCOO_09920 [Chitinophagaceae bacterium]